MAGDTDSFLNLIQTNEIELLNIAGGIPENGFGEVLKIIEYEYPTNAFVFSSESELFVIERELFWDDKFVSNSAT